MTTIQPPLGPGLHGNRGVPAGTLSEQPVTADGHRLDDLVGYRFALLLSRALAEQIDADVRQHLSDLDIVLIEDEAQAYLNALSAGAILIRPDRYIFGLAKNLGELKDLIAALPLKARVLA